MRTTAALIILLIATLFAHHADAQPNRDSLLEAWETHVGSLPGTTSLQAIDDGVYEFHDTDLPYEGALKIIGALVRPSETAGFETEFTHIGMVDFELKDLPAERLSSQVYYYWLADRQTLHYSETEQRWVNAATYQASVTELYSGGASFGTMSFMLNYGIWVLLIALLIFVFVAVGKQARKARSLMDETASINQKARENIERAEGLQDEVLAIARETRDLHADNNELLKKMLEALRN